MRISKIADICAIPCFLTAAIYYSEITSFTQGFLFLFFLSGFICDTIFVIYDL